MNFLMEKVRVTLEELRKLRDKLEPIDEFEIAESDYSGSIKDLPKSGWSKLPGNCFFKGKDKHYWLRFKITAPALQHGKALFLSVKTARDGLWDALTPQCLVFINSKVVQGIDINHNDVQLEFDREYDIALHLYTGMYEESFEFWPFLKTVDLRIEKLYYDLQVPYDACTVLKETDPNRIEILKALELALNRLDLRKPYSQSFYDSIEETERCLEQNLYKGLCDSNKPTVACIGHTHIDVAWLWTLSQTREKAQRSFATVLELMKRYPEYKFMSSQPQLYVYVKETQPELYEEIKKRISEKRWEAEGAMWVEADCNLTSGESLIRQILYGKRFFMQEFGVDCKILWLPDVFGYSAALPQILKKSGIDKFVTSKISWNETNKMPYDTFMWEGIDGTEIFTYFITARSSKWSGSDRLTTYVGDIDAGFVLGTYERYQQKEYNSQTLITFGYGDGGGGPTREMLERQRRLSHGLPGLPKTEIKSVTEFLDDVQKAFFENCEKLDRKPRWCGELYLEMHRGTYTSIAEIKKNNRESEGLLYKAELLSSVNNVLCGLPYPQEDINALWRTLLLNQFHDILPGSSILEVYEESSLQFKELKERAQKLIKDGLAAISGNINSKGGLFVFNPNPFKADGFAKIGKKMVAVRDVPPLGWKVYEHIDTECRVKANRNALENDILRVTFDDGGNIISIYDKEFEREIIRQGEIANEIIAFEDFPRDYDAWEITDYYKQKYWRLSDIQFVEVLNEGARAGLRFKRRYLDSAIDQRIYLYENSRRIDFETEIDWKEEHQLLKTFFPVAVRANKVTYEIQYGNIERPNHGNTSWDAAKFEVCAHKWADISDGSYGVSLINDCKYGHSAEGSKLSLTLLKCATYPNPKADKGIHNFTYSLYPHGGNYRCGGTVREAYMLNRRLVAFDVKPSDGALKDEYSFVSCDRENVYIEAVKKAEDDNGCIVRLYDAYDMETDCTLTFGFDFDSVYVCDIMENRLQKIAEKDNKVKLRVKNFEIVTLKIYS